jgi:16S rRNA A1518/A1519 N6-dimethyltransferase RsmA/KsgA/DIM1 with predicted DNA glycosylase/AP lyase activity
VLTSKNIIIFNEEILVLISFIAFFVTCQKNLQDSVTEAFQTRRDTIQLELQNYLTVKENLIQGLSNEYKKQLNLQETMHQLGTFSCNELLFIGQSREQALSNICKAQVQQKLKTLSSVSQTFQLEIQKTLAGGFRGVVLEGFHRSKKSLKAQLVQQALSVLKGAR